MERARQEGTAIALNDGSVSERVGLPQPAPWARRPAALAEREYLEGWSDTGGLSPLATDFVAGYQVDSW
jgi:hypothetical protein